MFKNKESIIVWCLFYLLIFSWLLYNSFNYLDTDFGWHLKIGEQISLEKKVPIIEKFDYPIMGRSWVDHEWLANVLLFLVYKYFGFFALNIIFALLVILVLILLNRLLLKFIIPARVKNEMTGKLTFLLMFFELGGVLAMSPHLGVRIQEIALLYIVLLLLLIKSYEEKQNWRTLIFLPLLFFFWANTHASFLIGLFILILWLAIKSLERIFLKFKLGNFLNYDHSQPYSKIVIFFAFSCFALAATMFTPYGLKIFYFLADYGNTFYMTRIEEWLPAFYLPIQYKQLLYIALFIFIFCLNLFYYFQSDKKSRREIGDDNYKNRFLKIDLFFIVLSWLLIFAAIKSKRHFPLFFTVSLAVLIPLCLELLKFIFAQQALKNFLLSKIVKIYLVCGFISSALIFFLLTNYNNNPLENKKYCEFYPCQALNIIKEQDRYRDQRLFNNYGWGGWLIHAWPGKQLFIDGRLPQLELAGQTFLEEYYDFFKKDESERKLDEYKIGLVLLPRETKIKLDWYEKYILWFNEDKINSEKNHLKEYLDRDHDWISLYNDNVSYLYVKNQSTNQ